MPPSAEDAMFRAFWRFIAALAIIAGTGAVAWWVGARFDESPAILVIGVMLFASGQLVRRS